MNPTIDLLLSHRSIRAFTTDPVPDDHIAAAVRAGQAASTSSAVQAYCVIQINAPDARREIGALAGNQSYVESAPAFFVVCAESRRHRLAAARDGHTYDTRLEAFLVSAIDAALFAQNMATAFESLGYGICYIGGLRNDLARLDTLLGLPEGVYPLFGMCVGRPAHTPSLRPRLPVGAVLMQDRYHEDGAALATMHEYDERYRGYLAERDAAEDQIQAAWSGRMATYHGTPRREYLARYYASKGARLD